MRVWSSSQQGKQLRCRPLRSADGSTRAAVAAADGGRGGGEAEDGIDTVGVIVCDHGSRRENANAMLFEVAERYRSFSGFDIVEVCSTSSNEKQSPSTLLGILLLQTAGRQSDVKN